MWTDSIKFCCVFFFCFFFLQSVCICCVCVGLNYTYIDGEMIEGEILIEL